MNILAIETSCDETSAAVVAHEDSTIIVKSNTVISQIDLHKKFGGVVPNLAGGAHGECIHDVVERAISDAKIDIAHIDALAVTHGPGLMPALTIGVSTAKALAYSWAKPLYGIHHIEGHTYSNWIDSTSKSAPQFPAITLIVSGGHTQIVLMKNHFDYTILGQTKDDAVGEAFDKAARILGLPYPGGPEIQNCAQKVDVTPDKQKLTFTPPMLDSGDFDFSFSGLKTAVLYHVQNHTDNRTKDAHEQLTAPEKAEIAYAFQDAAVRVLTKKTLRAAKEYGARSILLAGGVSANTHLRATLTETISDQIPNISLHIPKMRYCLDNAAMIGAAALMRAAHAPETLSDETLKLGATPRIPL